MCHSLNSKIKSNKKEKLIEKILKKLSKQKSVVKMHEINLRETRGGDILKRTIVEAKLILIFYGEMGYNFGMFFFIEMKKKILIFF